MRTLPFLICTLFGFSLPLPLRAADLLPADRPVEQVVDHYIDELIQRDGVVPAPQADDATLVRRLSLDLIGRIPTTMETKTYVESTVSHKRVELVDRLMSSPAYVRHQATMFEAMMATTSEKGNNNGALRDYFNRAIGENRPWSQIFRELVTPQDSDPKQKGASEFLKQRVMDLDRLTNEVSVVFFGVNVSCAQCHDHPLVNDWKQDHFFGMKSFFSRTFDNGGFLAEREFGIVKFKPTKGAEKQAKMMFLTGKALEMPNEREPNGDEQKKEKEKLEKHKTAKTQPPAPTFSARAKLVETALQPAESEFFSKSIANRMWHRFFGYGLVNPLDQMHSENAPSHPDLLQWLARDAASHNYDLRRIIRGIVLSQTYSRSSKYPSESPPSSKLFAVARLKPMTPMQLATSLKVATTDPLGMEQMKPDEREKRLEGFEAGARGFANSIAQPSDDFQIGVNEALLFTNNSRLMQDYLADGGGTLLGRVKELKDPKQAIDMIVRTVMGRAPSEEESKVLGDYLQRRNDRLPEAYKQITWALISSAEFRFSY